MDKQIFIRQLREALDGRLSPSAVTENIDFYEDYIHTEIRKGRSADEVLASLGDPRLIARTIIDTNGPGGAQEAPYRETAGRPEAEDKPQSAVPVWARLLIGLVIAALGISLFFSVLSFLLPVLLPVAIVILLGRLFRKWLR
ncbi:MAG: DUF1700 domain-containing protein [Clostridium sp.]|jgi:uncharacterized membrane protein|nr:DUF1700 domain-containing protein [Clostridium sp.]